MMKVFRLSRKKYANELSGKGAAISGNRWNSKGTEIIYTAESRALAMAEVMVHLSLSILPSDYMMLEVEIPEEIGIKEIAIADLEKDWNSHPPRTHTQIMGDQFIRESVHSILKVPSAVVPGDSNYLINPHHIKSKEIKIINSTPFPFDERLFD
jgi:RES domain-containing protein